MVAIEIILIIVGIICVIVSLVMNFDNKEDNTGSDIPSELSEEQKNKIKQQIDKMIDEQISGVAEKTEASLDKISNTKILEMNEYAESVLGEINRNHNETVFLYDMLNEKAKEMGYSLPRKTQKKASREFNNKMLDKHLSEKPKNATERR